MPNKNKMIPLPAFFRYRSKIASPLRKWLDLYYLEPVSSGRLNVFIGLLWKALPKL
jgi:hypothetical protein